LRLARELLLSVLKFLSTCESIRLENASRLLSVRQPDLNPALLWIAEDEIRLWQRIDGPRCQRLPLSRVTEARLKLPLTRGDNGVGGDLRIPSFPLWLAMVLEKTATSIERLSVTVVDSVAALGTLTTTCVAGEEVVFPKLHTLHLDGRGWRQVILLRRWRLPAATHIAVPSLDGRLFGALHAPVLEVAVAETAEVGKDGRMRHRPAPVPLLNGLWQLRHLRKIGRIRAAPIDDGEIAKLANRCRSSGSAIKEIDIETDFSSCRYSETQLLSFCRAMAALWMGARHARCVLNLAVPEMVSALLVLPFEQRDADVIGFIRWMATQAVHISMRGADMARLHRLQTEGVSAARSRWQGMSFGGATSMTIDYSDIVAPLPAFLISNDAKTLFPSLARLEVIYKDGQGEHGGTDGLRTLFGAVGGTSLTHLVLREVDSLSCVKRPGRVGESVVSALACLPPHSLSVLQVHCSTFALLPLLARRLPSDLHIRGELRVHLPTVDTPADAVHEAVSSIVSLPSDQAARKVITWRAREQSELRWLSGSESDGSVGGVRVDVKCVYVDVEGDDVYSCLTQALPFYDFTLTHTAGN